MAEPFRAVLEAIESDRAALVDLCLTLGNLPDYSGEERAVGEAVVGWLQAGGIEAWLQVMSAESVNAVGLIHGSATGPAAGVRSSSTPIWTPRAPGRPAARRRSRRCAAPGSRTPGFSAAASPTTRRNWRPR